MNLPKMKWFKCECGNNFEDLVEKDDTEAECEKCGHMAQLDTKTEVLHRNGNHYNHVTWSIHHAGE